MNGCGQLRVKIERVPVHLRQAQNLLRKPFEVCLPGMAAYRQGRGNPAFALKVPEPRVKRVCRAMNPEERRLVVQLHRRAPPYRITVIGERPF
jgi:hypothetical protein